MARKPVDINTVQQLLNQLSYEDFITTVAVIASQHPLGGIRQVEPLPDGRVCIVYAGIYDSITKASRVIQAIETLQTN